MRFVLTTIAWVETLARKEIEKCDWKIDEVTDRLIVFSWWIELIPRINIWSRVGNKMYILLAEKDNLKTFDELFDLMSDVSWKKYFKRNFPIHIKATSERSELISEKTIQSIAKKAIIKSLVWDDIYDEENASGNNIEILVLIINDKARVMLNTSGNALHMRWYRKNTWLAPIKESLAAALVLLSNWKFKEPFYDIFCWSGTIAIEALMIAKNIAPWLNRKFAFEHLWIVNTEVTDNERLIAKKREYSWEYTIIASDNDEKMIEIARENLWILWQEGQIQFLVKDNKEYLNDELVWTLVSNPPYGERMKSDELNEMYQNINKLLMQNKQLSGWIISSYLEFDNMIKQDKYKKRKLYNWNVKCYFWKKI